MNLIEFCIASDYHSKSINLEEENQKLKEEIDDKKKSIKALKIALKERTDERDNYWNKEHLYKSVLDEIREYIKNENYKNENICVVDGIEILRILDKKDN